jgi:hypothetical protein
MYPRNMVCFRYTIVNTLHKSVKEDDDDDDDDDDHNNAIFCHHHPHCCHCKNYCFLGAKGTSQKCCVCILSSIKNTIAYRSNLSYDIACMQQNRILHNCSICLQFITMSVAVTVAVISVIVFIICTSVSKLLSEQKWNTFLNTCWSRSCWPSHLLHSGFFPYAVWTCLHLLFINCVEREEVQIVHVEGEVVWGVDVNHRKLPPFGFMLSLTRVQ